MGERRRNWPWSNEYSDAVDAEFRRDFHPELLRRLEEDAAHHRVAFRPAGLRTASRAPSSPLLWGLGALFIAAVPFVLEFLIPGRLAFMGGAGVFLIVVVVVLTVACGATALLLLPGWLRARRIARAWVRESGGRFPTALRWYS